MAFKLNGKLLAVDVPFTVGEGENAVNYPATWLRHTTLEEKKAIGITEVADPKVYNSKFYLTDGTPKKLDDENATDKDGNLIKNTDGSQHINYGLKTQLKKEEKQTADHLLSRYDWLIVRKAEKGTAIPTTVQTFRDQVRTACDTREKEIDNCTDVAALVTLYSSTEQEDGTQKPNMTQYPNDPNIQVIR